MNVRTNDQILTQRVIDELAREPLLADSPVDVVVSSGIVTVSGELPSLEDAIHVQRCVMRIDAVKAVVNEISVRSPELQEQLGSN